MRRLPLEAVPPRTAAVVWAVMCGARTVREVGEACGYISDSAALPHLRAAGEAGLLDFTDHEAGTLRPLYFVVAFTPR